MTGLNLDNVDNTVTDTGSPASDRSFLVFGGPASDGGYAMASERPAAARQHLDSPAAVLQPRASVSGEVLRLPLWAAVGPVATTTGRCDR